uniref:Uncharacterized protein n=1 Tax=Pseudomonas aeruginosa TaxID=287 RepID=A0A7S6K390_PSEAI|nr:hypothetical protein [Pseudomonas aeruginosa]
MGLPLSTKWIKGDIVMRDGVGIWFHCHAMDLHQPQLQVLNLNIMP